jgi:hypothetical protein
VIVSTVTLAPGQTQRLLGLELLAIGAALWIACSIFAALQISNGTFPVWWVWVIRAAGGQLATLPFCAAGLSLLVRSGGGLHWLVPGSCSLLSRECKVLGPCWSIYCADDSLCSR